MVLAVDDNEVFMDVPVLDAAQLPAADAGFKNGFAHFCCELLLGDVCATRSVALFVAISLNKTQI
jgi:hypothetical protein